MKGEERRKQLLNILSSSNNPVSGGTLAKELNVSRQIIVQDISLLRANGATIFSTNKGYLLQEDRKYSRVFKVYHTDDQVEEELSTIVDAGGQIRDVFVYHKVYGVLKADMGIKSRRDIRAYMEEIMQYFNKEHICDGLPIIPPTRRRYERMMEYCPWPEDTKLVDSSGPSGKEITVKDVAIAAVMAGCEPTAMPVLVAAFKALNSPLYNFNQSVTTSHPGGNMCIVSGPIAQQIGVSGKQGCQGPGWPVNATIGRAINLVLMNVLRSVPGVCDLDCIASQAEFTYCFAEEPSVAQWNMINEDRFDSETTTVYLLKAEPIHDIIDFLSLNGHDLLDTITACCTTLGSNNAYMPGPLVICLTPDHAMMLKKDGYTKEMSQEHIHQYVYHQTPMVNGRGLVPVRPKEWANRHPLPVTRTPKDVEVVTIGGRGGHSGVILPWALHSEGCVEALRLPDGTIAKSVEEFKR